MILVDISLHRKTVLESICLFTLAIDHTHEKVNLVTNRLHDYLILCSTSKLSDLMQHKQIHTEDEPHRCDACGKTFKRKSNLKRHNFIHTQDTPFRCDKCEQSFKGKGDLGKHILFHNGVRPYKCATCGKSFSQNVHLM